MIHKILMVLVVSIFAYSHPLIAQKWGKVSKEVLEMTSIPEDPEADAVILFDKGKITITRDFRLVFEYHRRIKILTERGLKYADISIPFFHEDGIKALKAHTILPSGKKVKLKKKDVFEKKGGVWKEKVFAFPGVEVGSVIEYRYEKYSKYIGFLEPWKFQNQEFTKVSELDVFLPAGFNYKIFGQNFPGHDPKAAEEDYLGGTKFTWRIYNFPGIKPEPYMLYPLKDYFASIHFQIVSFEGRGGMIKFIDTWEDLAQRVRVIHEPFLIGNKELEKLFLKLLHDDDDDKIKAQSIYNYVKNAIDTTPYRGLLSDRLKKSHELVKDKKGSAVEKNLMLVNLLRQAGLEAHPLYISTLDHGPFSEWWTTLRQLNHVIAYLRLGHTSYFLDTKNKHCPFGMLPPNDLTYQGLLIEESGRIIEIPTSKSGDNIDSVITNAKLSEDGNLICHTVLRFEGYSGLKERTDLSYRKSEDYVKEILEDRFSEVTIDSATFKD